MVATNSVDVRSSGNRVEDDNHNHYYFSLLFIICFELIFTNFYVICVLLRSKCNGNKANVKIFVISLSVCDLLVGTVVTPFAVILLITDNWIAGGAFCTIWQMADQFTCTTCTLTLCVISVDRYWALKAPINHNVSLKKKSVYLIVAFIWIISILITITPFVTHQFSINNKNNGIQIFDNEYTNNSNPSTKITCASTRHDPLYVLFVLIISFLLPFTALIFVNYKTYRIVSKQIFAVRTLSREMRSEKPLRNSAFELSDATHKQFKLTVTFGLIVGCFTLSWTPYFFCYALFHICEKCIRNPGITFKVTSWLAWCSSGINPVIYMLMNYKTFFTSKT
ncbi:hypothetical protein B4U80_10727 [Leptotrombidium deliense]|uniref:G-protein coupled receptors family 1 profile domain-containing protein n=1 Tax=Leptotrombidium deliense TaxID=299467 RepID=A0A443RXD5_9ACAR|nr:hypothetical protein B4U80_10727 [Leptotrombidium deliense]